jgi:hypothetical protein
MIMRNKLSHIEPSVFKNFAGAMFEAHRREEGGEIDESENNKPFRDSDLNKAVGKDRTKPVNVEEQPPRSDYSRPVMKAASDKMLLRVVSGYTGLRFQKRLDELARRLEAKERGEYESPR